MKVRIGLFGALVACVGLLFAGAPANAKPVGQASAKGKTSHKGHKGKRGKRGRRGPAGPPGPVGPKGDTGPQGPPGTVSQGSAAVFPFKFLAIGNTSNTTIQTFTGAVAESGCQGGTFNQARLRSTADNGAAEVINLRLGGANFDFQPDFDTGENVALNVANQDDQHGLTYMSANGTQVVSAHYSAYDGAGIGGQFDCAIFGTSQVG